MRMNLNHRHVGGVAPSIEGLVGVVTLVGYGENTRSNRMRLDPCLWPKRTLRNEKGKDMGRTMRRGTKESKKRLLTETKLRAIEFFDMVRIATKGRSQRWVLFAHENLRYK